MYSSALEEVKTGDRTRQTENVKISFDFGVSFMHRPSKERTSIYFLQKIKENKCTELQDLMPNDGQRQVRQGSQSKQQSL